MNQITKYLNKEFFISIVIIMLGLIALFSFFDFIQEINDLGKGGYGLTQVFIYVLLSIPGHIYEVIPLAVLIGAMYTVGTLSQNSEFTVMRSSGLSIKKIAASLIYVGIFFCFLTFIIGDLISPNSEKNAQQLKISSTDSVVSQEFKSGFWIKDGKSFVNIENVLPDSSLEDIHIYEFDKDFKLRTIVNAKQGLFEDGQWKLVDISLTTLEAEKVTSTNIENGNWKSLIRPEMMNALIISPEKMSTINLLKFINYLKLNNQKVKRYEIALWEKLIHPIMPLVMLLFAVPFGFLQERSGGKYLKMFLGIIIGISYQILNTMIRHIGLLNDWQPFLSSLIPTIIFLSIGLYLIFKIERL
jgi:lipopolysaccharide export system permease protein|tara:strand:- start:2073 stop:3143 length:1071 start_codon:yes stop_codon:yes gene_type:complete